MQDRDRTKRAIKIFLYSDKIKTCVILTSKILRVILEKHGNEYFRRVFRDVIDALRSEVLIAYNATKNVAFKEVDLLLNKAINYFNQDNYDEAFNQLSRSISTVTSLAMEGVTTLEEEKLI